jgi:ribonuclease Z
MPETTIIPLGTASAIPTRERHPSATALLRKGRVLLFDCGEGTQMRFIHAGLKITRIDAVFITHFHGDHYFGLPGLLATLSMINREDPLAIVGPAGIGETIATMPGINLDRSTLPVEFIELHETFGSQIVYETDEVFVEARPIDHRTFAAGYRFEERSKPGHLDVERARELGLTDYEDYRALKSGRSIEVDGRTVTPEMVVGPDQPGRSFAYVTDTRPCETGRILARSADLVYHEATFTEVHADNAVRTGHSTAREAADVALRAEAKRLLIGHFSARHADPSVLSDEARAVFKNTEVAEELKRYSL